MRRHRVVLAGTLGVILSIAVPAALAQGADRRPVVTPIGKVGGVNGGELVGAVLKKELSTPLAKSPYTGKASPCQYVRAGSTRVLAVAGVPSAKCRIKAGTPVLALHGASCSNVEEPPFFGEDEPAQRACVADVLRENRPTRLQIRIDGGGWKSVRKQRYKVLSPQMTVQLPEENLLNVPAQEATFVLGGWAALVRGLQPGRHVLRYRHEDPQGKGGARLVLKVSRRGAGRG